MSPTQNVDSPERRLQAVWDAVETVKNSVLVQAVRNSVLLTLALAGVVMILAGAILQSGVLAAMFAIWGAGLFLVGATGYALIWFSRQ